MNAAMVDASVRSTPTSGNTASSASSAGEFTQVVSFRLANEEYGVDIMRAQEIIMVPRITRLPEVPDYICGLINLRGRVIPVLDLRRRFGLPAKEADEQTRIIVVNVESRTIGIVVDAVTEVLRIAPEQIEPPPTGSAGIGPEYIRGIIKRNDKLIIMLRIEEILSTISLSAIAPAAGEGAD